MNAFEQRDIERIVGPVSYRRGLDYVNRGMVHAVEFVSPSKVSGEVAGRQSRPYSVVVRYKKWSKDRLIPLQGSCTCPVGYNCKHTAAVLIAARQEAKKPVAKKKRKKAAGSANLPADIRQWLDSLPESAPARQKTASGGAPEPGRDHLFYIIRRDARGQVSIDPCRAYVKLDGEVGARFTEYNDFRDISSHARELLTEEDAAFLGRLSYYLRSVWPRRYAWPDGKKLIELIQGIVETGRARLNDIHGPVLAWAGSRRCTLAWEIDEAGKQSVKARNADGSPLDLLPLPTPLFIDPGTGETGLANAGLPSPLTSWLVAAPPVENNAVTAVAERLSRVGHQEVMPPIQRIEERDGRPEPVLRLFSRESRIHPYVRTPWYNRGSFGDPFVYPGGRLEITYPGVEKRLRVGSGEKIVTSSESGTVVIRRDAARERGFRERLREAVEEFAWPYRDAGRLGTHLPGDLKEAEVLFSPYRADDDQVPDGGLQFTMWVVPELRFEGWRVEIDESWPYRLHEGQVEISTTLESEENDWFSLRLQLQVDGRNVNVTPLVLQLVEALPVDESGQLDESFDIESHLADGVFHLRLEDGSWLTLESSRFARFAAAFLEVQGLLEFHRADAGRLYELAEILEGCGAPWTGGREILELGSRLQALAKTTEHKPPATLQADLRPYQRTGYGWLKALSDSGFGGVLADDMGLGKTVQTLSLLAYRHLELKTDRPSLLVVPTSLIGNWRREAARFVPDLRLLVLHGPDRQRDFHEIPNHHLVVTTYPLLNRDGDTLFSHDYEVAVLDEAQAVKNPAAAVSKCIRKISARQRLALTGTPLENNLQELWALFDWLVPGLLGNRKRFNQEYRTPIEKHGDRARQRLLSTRLKPFLMRRTKEEVASELPEKTVVDELVPLEGPQAALYESIRTAMDERVREAIAARGIAASRIAIIDALLKLRQVCCDPGLVKLRAARKVHTSAKRARLLALLDELVAEGRKILIFSQFVEMLKLVEQDIVSRGWDHAMLHGSTKNRDEQIERFQSGDVSLFLVSLKTGGTGLNLTAADTVIIYDPWWNPAVERQAMDRAHRIGQDKPVFVHRLIAENTVEAIIQRMQARKQALADALFEGTGQGPVGLTDTDISALFGPRQQEASAVL